MFMDFTKHKMIDQCSCFSFLEYLRSTVQILYCYKSLAVVTISPKSSLSRVISWHSPLSPLPSLVLHVPNIPDTCLTHLNSPVTSPKRSPQKAFCKSLNEYEWMTKWGQHMALWQLCQMQEGTFHLLPVLRCVPGLCRWWRVGAWSSVWRTLFILTIPTERTEKDMQPWPQRQKWISHFISLISFKDLQGASLDLSTSVCISLSLSSVKIKHDLIQSCLSKVKRVGTTGQIQRTLFFWHPKLQLVDAIHDSTTAQGPREALAKKKKKNKKTHTRTKKQSLT